MADNLFLACSLLLYKVLSFNRLVSLLDASGYTPSSFFFLHFPPMFVFALLLYLLPFRTPDPEPHSGHSSPVPATVRAFDFLIARRVKQFLPSSKRVELCVHTLGAFCRPIFAQETHWMGVDSRNRNH